MERLVDIVVCLSKCGKPFRGHDESKNSIQEGLFVEIVQLLKKYDPKNATYISNHIQNDLLYSIQNVIKRSIINQINNKWISIMADETSDLGHHEQLSIVISYFDICKNRPIKTFIGIQRVTSVNAYII